MPIICGSRMRKAVSKSVKYKTPAEWGADTVGLVVLAIGTRAHVNCVSPYIRLIAGHVETMEDCGA